MALTLKIFLSLFFHHIFYRALLITLHVHQNMAGYVTLLLALAHSRELQKKRSLMDVFSVNLFSHTRICRKILYH